MKTVGHIGHGRERSDKSAREPRMQRLPFDITKSGGFRDLVLYLYGGKGKGSGIRRRHLADGCEMVVCWISIRWQKQQGV